MKQEPDARVPRLVDGIDIRAQPIGPDEAFVISRIDGQSNEAEIAYGTGLPRERVQSMLERLHELGVLSFDAEPTRPDTKLASSSRRQQSTPTLPSKARPKGEPPPETKRSPTSQLAPEVASKIDELFDRLDSCSHYELLNVPLEANRKTIKTAYFDLVAELHPDRHFGKDLGAAKPKLDELLKRLTEAYDTLTRTGSRREYDGSLGVGPDPDAEAASVPASRASGAAPGSDGAPSSRADSGARRRALARKLGLNSDSGSRPSVTLPAMRVTRPRSSRSAETIPAPHEAAASGAQCRRFIDAANLALSEQNPVAAANSLRLALALAPSDTALRERLENVQQEADVQQQGRLVTDARSAASAGHWQEAAQLFARAARATQNAELYYFAAESAIQAQANPHESAGYVKAGLALSPDEPKLRVQLARIYAGAGMTSSALSELEKAERLRPDDDTIRLWIERVRKRRA